MMIKQDSNITFDIERIRNDFPILSRSVNGKPLIYFDNAATSQTPQQVIDVIVDYYSNYNSNIHKAKSIFFCLPHKKTLNLVSRF